MGAMIKKVGKISRIRVLSQVAALVILSLPILGLRTICGPAFHCHSCPLSAFACPIGVLVNFSTLRIIPYAAIGILGSIALVGGRLICGWICPFGLLQDLLYKIRTRKINLHPRLSYVKYIVLVVLVLLVPLLLPGKPYRFCDFCPAGTLESMIPRAFMGESSGNVFRFVERTSIMIGVVVLTVAASRGFCRTLCPLGAVFALFNKIALFRLRLTKHDCSDCGACRKTCTVRIDPVGQMNAAECVRCLDCTATRHIKLGIG